ncbi:MAG: hypothetical protein WCW25_01055 [Patescibacteria group bacterium]|jgi:tetratricopeptide (TPR) repeat protein
MSAVSSKKNLIFFSIVIVLTVSVGAILYFYKGGGSDTGLNQLKNNYPGLSASVDEIIKEQKNLKADKNNIKAYISLGMAWKTLAEDVQAQKIGDGKEYYREALKIYQEGIEAGQRKNTVLMVNAGSMAKYLGDYRLSEEYFKEAIAISPGETAYYLMLAELYEYSMKRSKEDIIAVYEQGIKRVLDPRILRGRIDDYLLRHGE